MVEPAPTIGAMNLIDIGLAPIRRLMHPAGRELCFVCHKPVRPSEDRIRLRDTTVVHRGCATYRMRNGHAAGSRRGFPR